MILSYWTGSLDDPVGSILDSLIPLIATNSANTSNSIRGRAVTVDPSRRSYSPMGDDFATGSEGEYEGMLSAFSEGGDREDAHIIGASEAAETPAAVEGEVEEE